MTVRKQRYFLKTLGKLFFILLGIGLALYIFFWTADFFFSTPATNLTYGVTFSPLYAEQLGLDPQSVYQSLLTDLQVKHLRIPVNWDRVEKSPGKYDFSEYDKMLDEARVENAQVILAIGYKVPRWPECTPPAWASSSQKVLEEQIKAYLQASVEHFKNLTFGQNLATASGLKNQPVIVAWQVENEPLLPFGNCQIFGDNFLEQEVNLVKAADSRPVVLTDSGELGMWVTAMKYSDLMGTSLYRVVWNPIFGYFTYPLPPLYYNLKARVTQALFAPLSHGVFVSELQAEPWSPGKPITKVAIPDQIKGFSLPDFQNVIKFTAKTEISEQYLWGVEWWYYMKENGHPEYWNFAKTLFHQ